MAIKKHQTSFANKIASLAIIAVSIIGLLNAQAAGYKYNPMVYFVVTPYAIAIILGFLYLMGLKWPRLPMIILSLAGMLLNAVETLHGPNQKDIAEVFAFLLIAVLILVDVRQSRLKKRIAVVSKH
ncbi:MAG: hypothetical protein HY779_03405 [Rubrobacteridae bacterium]|nr:hypothetical protein [Rubrobacteridae bacterium]